MLRNKKYIAQKNIVQVAFIDSVYVDVAQSRIRNYRPYVLYNTGNENRRTWNLFRNQIGFWFKKFHDTFYKYENVCTEKNDILNGNTEFKIITVLNGCGTLIPKNEDYKHDFTSEDKNNVQQKLWEQVYFIGVVKNNVDVTNICQTFQQQTSIVIHGDADIFNFDRNVTWIPGHRLILKLPSPSMNIKSIIIKGKNIYPENAVYPLVEPVQENIFPFCINAKNMLHFLYNSDNKEEKDPFPIWIQDFTNTHSHIDVIKSFHFIITNEKNNERIKKDILGYLFEFDEGYKKYAKAINLPFHDTSQLLKHKIVTDYYRKKTNEENPKSDPNLDSLDLFISLLYSINMDQFAMYDFLHRKINDKVIGKSLNCIFTGQSGLIMIQK